MIPSPVFAIAFRAIRSIRSIRYGLRASTLAVLIAFSHTAGADTVSLEINKTEQRDAGCLFYLVSDNSGARDFQSMKLDLVLFDTDDLILRRIAVNLAPLTSGKTSVKLFEIADTRCDAIGRVLINEVLDCRDDTGNVENCVGMLEPGSRTGISLFL